ncbi:kinetochore protein Sos7 [Chaetomidium leptoderma]|uniref:Kinetochore protein Sos7 n=1 Tax=Chaetomidium leptoderma TaxID=669021 RepID=A0AAN6ZYG8_9PEZI|nr:kinetochore protein Sos7 [Chaetomidium leptoderma]
MSRANSPAKSDRPRKSTKANAAALRALQDLQQAPDHDYTIIKISEPISSALTQQPLSPSATTATRNSDVSDTATTTTAAPTPASLDADLAHYRELFSKLRFSYVEQVTKEKFIRAIVGDPPLIVTPQENADLEAGNAAAKAELKALKVEVAGMVAGLETRGRALVGRYERVRREREMVGRLPGEIGLLEGRVGELKAATAAMMMTTTEKGDEARYGMNMPLGKTLELVDGKREEVGALERQLELLGGQVPRKRKEMERLRGEVAALENRKMNSAAAAREAKRRRENAQGGVEDELEARGRWYRASETVLRQVLDLQG